MRVKLKKGKQKRLICSIKEEKNMSWNKMSDYLGTSKSALIEWRKEKNLLPLAIFKKLDKRAIYRKFIIEIKDEKWGKIKGGLNSIGNTKKIRLPKKSTNLAELCGIILGDGNIYSLRRNNNVGVYNIRIAGDYNKDLVYLRNYVKPLIESLFKIKTKEYTLKSKNCHYIRIDSIKLIEFFNSLGIKSGNKIKNKQSIPKWILKNPQYLRSCIRGLVDTDGSIFKMSKKDPHLLRIGFTSYIPTLLQEVYNSLKWLGFNPNLIKNHNHLFLSKQKEIKKYRKMIGFRNQKHINRIQEFTKIAP